HTNYRIKTAYDSKNSAPRVEAFHYYVRFLLMLNRYRNIQEHMSINEKQYARKLKLSINVLLLRVLGFISMELNKTSNGGLTAEQVVKNLILEGKAKFDELNIIL